MMAGYHSLPMARMKKGPSPVKPGEGQTREEAPRRVARPPEIGSGAPADDRGLAA